MSKIFAIIGFGLYAIVSLYLLNTPFNFLPLPEFIKSLNNWIIFIGGILVAIGGVKYLLSSRGHGLSV